MAYPFAPNVPLYHQIASVLRERVQAHGALGASAVATEKDLCSEFGVSRSTLRQALAHLKRDGLLQSRRGVGTSSTAAIARRKLVRASGDPLHASLDSRPRVVSLGTVSAPAAVAAFFGLAADAQVFAAVRVHDLDGSPLSVVVSYLPATLAPAFTEASLRDSMHEVLWRRFHLRQARSVHAIRVARAHPEVAKLLGIGVAEPVLRIQSSVYLPDGRPIRWTENFFREDRYEYTAEMDWPEPAAPTHTPRPRRSREKR